MPGDSKKVTRKQRIDQMLKEAGWVIIPHSDNLDISVLTHHAVEELQTINGPADYGLIFGGKLLGFVEAKRLDVGAANVLEQAKRYSKGVPATIGEWNGYRVPFLNSSNGELIYNLDVRSSQNLSRQIYGFHTPEALESCFVSDKASSLQWLKSNIVYYSLLRNYQQRAIEAYEGGLGDGKRLMLLAMATGTRKTFITVNLFYRMLVLGYARKILFLVDRKSLAAQAVTAFAFFDTPRNIKFKDEYEVYSQRFSHEDFEGDPYDPAMQREVSPWNQFRGLLF
jgi:type I restriction enzyme, R subunit